MWPWWWLKPRPGRRRARLIVIDYEPLPVVTDPVAAMTPGTPILHPHPFRYPYGERPLDSNVLLEYKLKQGDIAAGSRLLT